MRPAHPRRSVLWFRRDLRMQDNPALLAAADGVAEVVPLFVVDPVLWDADDDRERAYLVRSLQALDSAMADALVLRHGDPVRCVVEAAREAGASSVHVAAADDPYGSRRDAAVAAALAELGVPLVRTGSAWATEPGAVLAPDDVTPSAFDAWYQAWLDRGWPAPVRKPQTDVPWSRPIPCDGYPEEPATDLPLPPAGEEAAAAHWRALLAGGSPTSDAGPDGSHLAAGSQLARHLRYGELHPRTLFAALGDGAAHEPLRRELARRELYADARLPAWQHGQTGFPFV